MELRGYQQEVVAPALCGRNTLLWLPTGAGKTRAAVHVCQQHLQSRRGRRVAVLVNKVHLVEQHSKGEFRVLQEKFRVTAISGDSSPKAPFACLARMSDVVICTAQLLQNALSSPEEDERVELTEFSLLVIDECHHTQKDGVYNRIMVNYLQRKLSGQKDLPQILGLTASPGTGGATTFEGAMEHILQICANLDVEVITSAQEQLQQLWSHVPQPRKQYDLCQERAEDPFGKQLQRMMGLIQQYMGMPELPQDFGTQLYEQRVVELEQRAAETFSRQRRVCALHLRKYNDALLIHDTVRMLDALRYLQQFYAAQRDVKDPTEHFLTNTFEENRTKLQALAEDQAHENPRLGKLEEILQEHFKAGGTSRGIVFTKTRQSAHGLLGWLRDTAGLQHLRAAVLTGASSGSQGGHMTAKEQQDVIKLFREGALDLLFSTSVAEEGLDIPECNIVVRYGLMTNEIAMMQARGRARAENSVYSVLAKANSREVSRELLNEDLVELMERAIRAVQAIPEQEYRHKVHLLQQVSVAAWQLRESRVSERRQLHDPDTVRLYCVNCSAGVCRGSDLRTVEGIHHVNINPAFGLRYRASSVKLQFQRQFRDWEPGCSIACRDCNQVWGIEMIYRQVKLPILSIKNFVVETPAEKRRYKKWSSVTFSVPPFDYVEYCS
ncbi:DHX58 helicase, partial [Turnix velox]|nr:DHX58 helicase [Turnix velox]